MNFSPGKLGDCYEHPGIQCMFLEVPWIPGCSSFTMTLDFQGSLYNLPRFPGRFESRYPGNYV